MELTTCFSTGFKCEEHENPADFFMRMWLCTFALRAPHFSTRRLRTLNRLPIVIVRSSGAFELYYSYFKSCNSAMAQSKSLSSDPEELLQFMDNLDSDFSDDDFEGYIDEDEWLEERMGRQISVQQEDGSGNSVVSVHGSRKRMSSNGMEGVVNDDGRNGSEDGDGTEGSENGDRMDGSDNGDGTEGSENGDRMDGSANGDGTEGSENDRMDSDGENRGSDDHVNTNRNGLPVFTENVGVIPDMMGKEPVDYYRLFITDSLLQNVLDETNLYGEQYVQSHQDYLTAHPRARSHDFVKRRFTMSELLWLIVLMITMGIVDLPSLKDYWSTSWPFSS